MVRFKKFILPVTIVCLLVAAFIGGSQIFPNDLTSQESQNPSLGEIFDPAGNPLAHRFSDVTDLRTATYIVAASDSVHKYEADYFCNGTNDHVQIQAALDALPDTGGEVGLLDGTYNTTADLTVPTLATLEGQGWSTIIVSDGAAVTNAIVLGGDSACVKNMKIILAAGVGTGGSRPNIVYAAARTRLRVENLWLVGDLTEGDDGSRYRQNGVLFDENCFYSEIVNSLVENCQRSGLMLYGVCTHNTVSGNNCHSNTSHNIFLEAESGFQCTHNVVTGNVCSDSLDGAGIYLTYASYNTISDNICQGNFDKGIVIYSDSDRNTIADNVCQGNDYGIYIWLASYNDIIGNVVSENPEDGIWLQSAPYNNVVDNICFDNYWGIDVETSDYCNINDNYIWLNTHEGISVWGSDNINVGGNYCIGNGQAVTNTSADICLDDSDYCNVQTNICRAGEETNVPNYGIEICGSSTGNLVKNNDLYDDGFGTAPFNDEGTDTKLASITVSFCDGTEPLDSGFLIDLAAEYARAFAFLNIEVTQVVRIKVYARSVVAEVHEMELEMVIYGGADNQAYTTHNGSVAQLDSTSVNFGADDIIYWTITEAGVLALLGGDSMEIKVLHEAAEGDNCATNAYFRTVTIEYV